MASEHGRYWWVPLALLTLVLSRAVARSAPPPEHDALQTAFTSFVVNNGQPITRTATPTIFGTPESRMGPSEGVDPFHPDETSTALDSKAWFGNDLLAEPLVPVRFAFVPSRAVVPGTLGTTLTVDWVCLPDSRGGRALHCSGTSELVDVRPAPTQQPPPPPLPPGVLANASALVAYTARWAVSRRLDPYVTRDTPTDRPAVSLVDVSLCPFPLAPPGLCSTAMPLNIVTQRLPPPQPELSIERPAGAFLTSALNDLGELREGDTRLVRVRYFAGITFQVRKCLYEVSFFPTPPPCKWTPWGGAPLPGEFRVHERPARIGPPTDAVFELHRVHKPGWHPLEEPYELRVCSQLRLHQPQTDATACSATVLTFRLDHLRLTPPLPGQSLVPTGRHEPLTATPMVAIPAAQHHNPSSSWLRRAVRWMASTAVVLLLCLSCFVVYKVVRGRSQSHAWNRAAAVAYVSARQRDPDDEGM